MIWGLVVLQEKISEWTERENIVSGVGVLIGLLLVMHVHRKDPAIIRFIYPTVHAWRHGNIFPEQSRKGLIELAAVTAAQRLTPERSKLFVTSDLALQIRFGALRPVVYAYKDGSTFAFSNYDALLNWHEVYKRVGGRFKKTGYSPAEIEQTMIPLARELDADYIFVFFGDYFEKLASNTAFQRDRASYDRSLRGVTHVWSNSQYGLYQLRK